MRTVEQCLGHHPFAFFNTNTTFVTLVLMLRWVVVAVAMANECHVHVRLPGDRAPDSVRSSTFFPGFSKVSCVQEDVPLKRCFPATQLPLIAGDWALYLSARPSDALHTRRCRVCTPRSTLTVSSLGPPHFEEGIFSRRAHLLCLSRALSTPSRRSCK
jgi:hypothetical protein